MIDKITAGILYSYGYKLKDSEGNVWEITRISSSWIDLMSENGNQYTATYEEIGTTYKILARDLEQLTQEIDGKVPLVECAKLAYPKDKDWTVYKNEAKCFRFDITYDTNRGFSAYYKNTMTPSHPFNQLPIFQYLYSLNFNIGFPEGTTINLI